MMRRIDAGDHLRLARRVVSSFLSECPALRHLQDDLLAGASLGLCEAAARYDGRPGAWGLYAHRYAFGYMMIVLRRHGLRHGRNHEQEPMQHGPDAPEHISDDAATGPEEACEAHESARQHVELVEWLVAWLSPDEWEVIRRRHGLGMDEMTMAKTARALGITKAAARQLEESALTKMQKALSWRNG